jgi:thiol-disulfide isomerase/thioredoxin
MKNSCKTTLLIMAIAFASMTDAQQVSVWKAADLKTALDTATVPTIFNFWATFCRPCIAELPYFQAAADQYKSSGVRLVLVSLDVKEAFPKKVEAFVKKRGLTSPVVFLDEPSAGIFVPLIHRTWSGAIPASLFIYRQRGYRRFFDDELSRSKLDREIRNMLGVE